MDCFEDLNATRINVAADDSTEANNNFSPNQEEKMQTSGRYLCDRVISNVYTNNKKTHTFQCVSFCIRESI